jgi:hypothetical protein
MRAAVITVCMLVSSTAHAEESIPKSQSGTESAR